MSLLLLEGFDDGLRDERWVTSSLPAPSSGSGENRLGLLQSLPSTSDILTYNLAAAEEHATLTVGVWVRPTVAPTNTPVVRRSFFRFKGDTGSIHHIVVHITPTLQLQVRHGDGTVLGTTDVIWGSTNTAHYIEASVTMHDSAGSVQVWSDGVSVLNLVGIDTRNGGTDVFDQFILGESTQPLDSTRPEIDDIYLTNGEGAAPWNGNLGDIIVDTLFPNDNGQYSDFAGSDGNSVDNHLLVDEAPNHDSDTTYVESGTDTDRESYDFDNLFYATGVIKGLIATAVVRNTGAADNLQVSTRIGATDYDGATQAAPAGYNADIREVWQVSPATGVAWTIAEINAAEFGFENVV